MRSVPGTRPSDPTQTLPRTKPHERRPRSWTLEEAVALAVCLALALSAMFCVSMMGG